MPSATEHEVALLHKGHVGQAESDSSTLAVPELTAMVQTRQPSRILRLPRELRDQIYESDLAQQDPSAYLDRRLGLVTTSPLAQINTQIRGEYLDIAPRSAPVIETVVRNLDFDHIISFIDALPAGRSQNASVDTAAQATDSSSEKVVDPESEPVNEVPTRTFIIELTFSNVNTEPSTYSVGSISLPRATPAQYRRWGDRIRRWYDFIKTNPKAAKVNFQYGARKPLPYPMAGLRFDGMMRWEGKAAEEASKMGRALDDFGASPLLIGRIIRMEVESSEDEQDDDE